MPKDEFDPDDPLELTGVGLFTEEDTTQDMAECFIEEFMRLGYTAPRILALFRNGHYLGTHMALQNRGDAWVRERIVEVFARWGRPLGDGDLTPPTAGTASPDPEGGEPRMEPTPPSSAVPCDPMGHPVPDAR